VKVAGAVLCGGASRRMGRDKALIEIDGTPMAERIAAVLEAAGCDPVVFVGGDEEALSSTGRRHLPDLWPGEGPAGGVISALAALESSDAVVVCACDLPDLSAAAVRDIVGTVPFDADVRVADSGRLEPLLACWRLGAAPKVVARFEGGARSMHDVLAALDVHRVAIGAEPLRNVNRPGDLGD
jgi:molybdenum cofactor guanylyltransferase